jgi:taurine dioxygenase
MSNNKKLKIVPGPKGFAAEATGAELHQPLGEAIIEEVIAGLNAHGVLVFPDQEMDPTALETFTRMLGEFEYTEFVVPIKGHPHVLELRREPRETAFHFGSAWHSDVSYQEKPPAATILYGHIVPPVGGDTLFADERAAWLALPDDMKAALRRLKCIHSAAEAYNPAGFYGPGDDPTRSMKIVPSDEALDLYAHHPLIRTHPATGEKILWFNPLYVRAFEGLPRHESDELIEFLTEFTTRDDFVHRHKWQKNMLVMWDNCRVQHFAEAGFDGHRRVMWRTTIAGDVPV